MKLKLSKWLFNIAFKLCSSNKSAFNFYYEVIKLCYDRMNKLEFSKDNEGFAFTKETCRQFEDAIPYLKSITFDKQFIFSFAKQNLKNEELLREKEAIENTANKGCDGCENIVGKVCGLTGNPLSRCNMCVDYET